jgi:beta-mannosidase
MTSLLSLLALSVYFFASSHAVTVVPLAGNDWVISNNQSLSAQGQVPGTIHTILFAANLIPDPYFGYNDVNLRYLVYSSWTFRKNFSLTDDFLSLTQFTLDFDQIDTVANITLNGCFIGQTNSMFIPYSFNVTRSCLQSNNELRIDFESPIVYAANQAKAYNQTVLPECPQAVQHGECHVQFIRKEICSFSWDWVRRIIQYFNRCRDLFRPSVIVVTGGPD